MAHIWFLDGELQEYPFLLAFKAIQYTHKKKPRNNGAFFIPYFLKKGNLLPIIQDPTVFRLSMQKPHHRNWPLHLFYRHLP